MGTERTRLGMAILASAVFLSGCEAMSPGKPTLDGEMDVIEATELTELMLNFREPDEAAAYFQGKLNSDPNNVDHMRGLAISLTRAGRNSQAALAYKRLIDSGKATPEDQLLYAEALLKGGDIDGAKAELDKIPPTLETYKRYLLEAIVADNRKDWTTADSFYSTARGLTARPAPVLNNWGMSKMARGDLTGASNLFQEAITFDPKLFTAKNNLVNARGQQRIYQLPVIPMNETEEAQLLYNLGIIAVRQCDVSVAKGLFELAVDTHPEHFPEAVQAQTALETPGGC